MLSPLAIALQGLGFAAAQVALQGMLALIDQAVKQEQQGGGGASLGRRSRRMRPSWLPTKPKEEDEVLLLMGIF